MLELDRAEYNSIIIHYGEITLKRGKRGRFERILHRNLEEFTGVRVRRLQGRFVIDLEPGMDAAGLLERVGKVFGVVWYAPAIRASTLEELREVLLRILSGSEFRSLKVDVRRSDKRFPMTSIEVARTLGRELASELGVKVDLKNPEKRIFVEITEDGIYASLMRLRGPGGLPLGSSGKVLGLYSGGAGSALACWFMMKRGCRVDLLHVREKESGGEILEPGITHNLEKLLEYSLRLKLFLASSRHLLELVERAPEDERAVLKMMFILRLGEEVAKLRGYPGLVLGSRSEDLGLLRGLLQILSMRRLPVYMPLIALTRDEFVERCGLLGFREDPRGEGVSSHPMISNPAKLWRRLEDPVSRAIEGMEVYELRLGAEPRRIGLGKP